MHLLRTIAPVLLFATSAVHAQNAYDAKILEYTGLNFPCEGLSRPVLKIQNVGTTTMLTCVVETWKNGLQVSTFNWQLAAPALTGDVRQPVLPDVPNVAPEDELEFRIISVNEVADEGSEGNIIAVDLTGSPVYADDGNVVVEVATGEVPGAVQWTIKNSSSTIVAQGGPYEEANTLVEVSVPLDDLACYSFEAVDASRGGSSQVVVRVLQGGEELVHVEGPALGELFKKGVRTGNGEGCVHPLILEVRTDAAASETSWEVVERGTNALMCSGNDLSDAAINTENCCLPNGCYALRVFDAGGDGIAGGGYILRTATGAQRIIDNRGNFQSGSLSRVDGGEGFCLPMGSTGTIYTSCDKLDWVNGQFIVAAEDPQVTAVWNTYPAGSAERATTGYVFWFFDPNGGYTFRRFRSHATSDGYPATGPARACHTKMNSWSAANHIPDQRLVNVRIRARVNGVNAEWGPACRAMVDPVRAACPYTKLMDIPGNQFYSCGVTRMWGGNRRVHARPVSGATQYQFRFRNLNEGVDVVRTNTTYYTNLNWTPALANGQYWVFARAFKNGAWCSTQMPWGDSCLVTITGSPMGAGMGLQDPTIAAAEMSTTLFPNPNNGTALWLNVVGTAHEVGLVKVRIFTTDGRLSAAGTYPVEAGAVSTLVDLSDLLTTGTLPAGMYLVRIDAGEEHVTERLVIQ